MSTELPPHPDPTASTRLQVLATEHWSLLATRALTYQESLGRVNMFLAVLSGSVIALALVAQADRFSTTFIAVAIFMLTIVFFVGVATVRRLNMLNADDYRWVVGMNRLRHAYLELHPELEPHFITSQYDDLQGAMKTLALDPVSAPSLGTVFHGFVTLPGMIAVIVASVGGAIAGLAAIGFGAPAYLVLIVGAAAFALALFVMFQAGRRSFRGFGPSADVHFPTPQK